MRIKTRSRGPFQRRQDPSLAKIIVAIVLVGAAVAGVLRFSEWFRTEYAGGDAVSAAAPTDDLAQARALLERGAIEDARRTLKPVLARVEGNATLGPKALLLQAEIHRAAGETDAALERLHAAAYDFAGSPEQPRAAAAYAALLEDMGRDDEALKVYEQLHKTAPPEWQSAAVAAFARRKEAAGERIAARDMYREALGLAPWGSENWLAAADGLGRLNAELIFWSGRTPDSKVYEVEPGDSLTSIGIELNTTQGLLMRANGLDDPNRLYPGQTLKYTPKDFRIVIERSTARLYLFDSSGLFKMYRVGLGKSNHETTLGQYRIGNKEKDPTWFKPGSAPIPPGDPENELGTRWMPLVPEAEDLPGDLGIHGTIRPESIGKYESMGCPRMHNADVEELYDLVVRATPVSIVEKYYPEDAATG